MNLDEYAAKSVLLKPASIPIPQLMVCTTAEEAADALAALGPAVIKAQVPSGKRGKSGGIRFADSPEAAADGARAILGMEIGGHRVERLLMEERCEIARELYASVLIDVDARSPVVLFSMEGGMDIEEIAARDPEAIRRHEVNLDKGFNESDAAALLSNCDLGRSKAAVADVLVRLYEIFRNSDAELIEINPLAVLRDDRVLALDCKFVLDDAAGTRQPKIAAAAAPPRRTELEVRGEANGLKFIQLDGNVGLLANGAGLTMTTMDTINHFGGRPANFLEIGGEAYTKAEVALDLVLSNPGVKSLAVIFCGAFARTDVMAEGVVRAWETLKPKVPVFFSIHGTGEEEAVKLVRDRLGIEPFEEMEDAVKAAVEAAQ
ncbi:MAG TPA: ATP-grasp domain-containing protein [Bradyrhizobium sp.]|nr:ATP-grasp domain-containing protein [Bradyrhizobium sp.]